MLYKVIAVSWRARRLQRTSQGSRPLSALWLDETKCPPFYRRKFQYMIIHENNKSLDFHFAEICPQGSNKSLSLMAEVTPFSPPASGRTIGHGRTITYSTDPYMRHQATVSYDCCDTINMYPATTCTCDTNSWVKHDGCWWPARRLLGTRTSATVVLAHAVHS